MKRYFLLFFLQYFAVSQAQIELLNTGTNNVLDIPSVIGNNILVTGNIDYLVKSYDECDNFTPLTIPGTPGYTNFYQRLSTNLCFAFSANFNAYDFSIHKSIDDGQSWIQIFDSIGGAFFTHFAFFDANEGILLSTFGKMARTKDGGNTWLSQIQPLNLTTAIKTYEDSVVCIGGDVGTFIISKDRGNTWYGGGGFGTQSSPTDFFFLNRDTIFAIGTVGAFQDNFAKSFDKGITWKYNNIAPANVRPYGLYAKSKNEIYAVGATSNTTGIILKSTDLGQTWSRFNTGIKTELTRLKFLNDSIALVSGSNGVLFKWNSKQTVFTGINEHEKNTLAATLFPNPVKDKLNVKSSELRQTTLHCTISNVMGEIVFMKDLQSTEPEVNLDVSVLSQGIYFVKLKQDNKQGLYKFIKE